MNERMNTTYLGLFASIYYIFTTYFIQKYFVVDTDIIRHPATLLYTYTTHCCIEKLLSVPPPAPMSKICQQIGCSCDWFSHFFSCMKAFSGVTLTMNRPGDQHLPLIHCYHQTGGWMWPPTTGIFLAYLHSILPQYQSREWQWREKIVENTDDSQ